MIKLVIADDDDSVDVTISHAGVTPLQAAEVSSYNLKLMYTNVHRGYMIDSIQQSQ